MMLLEADLTLAGASGRTPRGVVLGDELAAPADEQAAQLRQLTRTAQIEFDRCRGC